MKYTYSIVEAAAHWAGVEFEGIQARMNAADNEEIEKKYLDDQRAASVQYFKDVDEWFEQTAACSQCEQTAKCPDWELLIYEGDEVLRLNCPQNFRSPPQKELPPPRVVQKQKWNRRLLPHAGEFKEIPAFEERLLWLQTALSRGDLDGTQETVLAYDLREWMKKHFPGDQPGFLFPNENQVPQINRAESSSVHQPQNIQGAQEAGLTKREQQIRAIEAVADLLGYERQQVPDGGKAVIRERCLSEYGHLFGGGKDPFLDAWKEASKTDRVVMFNRDKFSGR